MLGSIRTKSYFTSKGETQSLLLDKLSRMRASLKLKEEKREPARSMSLQKIVSTEYYRKLFEEFFIIGPDNKELKGFKVNEVRYVRPKKLYFFPNHSSPEVLYSSLIIVASEERHLKNFAFPPA